MNNKKILTDFIKTQKKKISLSLGDFQLVKQLGQGGNGLVYEAVLQERPVAIKFLITEATGNSLLQKRNRFLAEYFNVVTLERQANIVRYIDYDLLNIEDKKGIISFPVIIMKKYDGALSRPDDSVNSDGFISLFNFLIKVLGQIHEAGIIHRDIKPENILVQGSKYVLADFGIANYNPEIFNIRAKTEKGERMGNRLFSAPEQEEKDIDPHPTMDIYAMGQILQWYTTGKTHRGTGRVRITAVFENFSKYDYIINKCLENNPKARFQSVSEIESYIKQSREKNIWEYIYLFHRMLISNFPKKNDKIIHVDKINRIDRLFNSLKEKESEFEDKLWWNDGSGNIDFKLSFVESGTWKFGESEYKIKEIWINYDSSQFNDFILVHYEPQTPFKIGEDEIYHTAIVDDKYHISYDEYTNGYAEIGDEVIDLTNHKVEFIERQREGGFFFIGTIFHCILNSRNDEIIRQQIDLMNAGKNLEIENLKVFTNIIRRRKHPEVEISL